MTLSKTSIRCSATPMTGSRQIVGADSASREVFSIRSEDWTGAIDLYVNPANIGYASVYRRTSYEPYSGFAQR